MKPRVSFPCGSPFCRHLKSGLPSTPSNHKSDVGSLQSWNRSPQQFPANGSDAKAAPLPSRLRWSRRFSQACSRGGGIACVRKTAGFAPRRLFVSKQAGPAQARALVQKVLLGADGFKRNHGKVRTKPRHNGCGRHRHCAQAAAGGRSIIRHAHKYRRTAAGSATPAAAVGCRQETR
jgi:hypothetical protein